MGTASLGSSVRVVYSLIKLKVKIIVNVYYSFKATRPVNIVDKHSLVSTEIEILKLISRDTKSLLRWAVAHFVTKVSSSIQSWQGIKKHVEKETQKSVTRQSKKRRRRLPTLRKILVQIT